MNHKLADGMKKCKGNGNTTLLFSLKGLEIVHQERRGQVKTIVMEHFNGILFHKSEPANKQHYQPTKQTKVVVYRIKFNNTPNDIVYHKDMPKTLMQVCN